MWKKKNGMEKFGIVQIAITCSLLIPLASWYLQRDTCNLILDTWYLILDIWYLISDTWYLILDIWYFIFDTWFLTLDILYLISDTWYMISDIHATLWLWLLNGVSYCDTVSDKVTITVSWLYFSNNFWYVTSLKPYYRG